MTDPTPESGRELDAVVAEEVFGWEWATWNPERHKPTGRFLCGPEHLSGGATRWYQLAPDSMPLDDGAYEYVPRYSTDIESAWEVVDAYEEWADNDSLHRFTLDYGPVIPSGEIMWVATFGELSADAETAPEAICRAALKAVRADTEGADA